MCLKGQMFYVPETDKICFLCSPSVGCLEDLNERGLYLSDIPVHDSTRDLVRAWCLCGGSVSVTCVPQVWGVLRI